MFKLPDNNLQYVTSITFLLTTYAKYMANTKHTFNCGSLSVTPNSLRTLAKKQASDQTCSLSFFHYIFPGFISSNMWKLQIDYILGENPLKMSYMVGYGPNFPKRIHHRGSSLPSVTSHPATISCDGGFDPFLHSSNPNPNILTGAIVGGPNDSDGFPDDRTDYSHSEPTTYINAAIVGPLAYFVGSQST
jgi:endoglucanase